MKTEPTEMVARLEQAFAASGFAELGVDDLRAHTDVSLRTLYKHFPSRGEMVRAALEHRHERYIAHLFTDLPTSPEAATAAIFERIGDWMHRNASEGCLFHSAVAAYPHDEDLRALLERHKDEVAEGMGRATGLESVRDDLLLLHEGLTQSWRLLGDRAVARAVVLAGLLFQARSR
jgi:AcrR family transcriptional regulator